MTRNITNPADSSALASSAIRDELQTLENEITSITIGHDHDGTDSKKLDWDLVWSDAAHDHSSDAEGGIINSGQIPTAGLADDAVGPTKIAETGWGATGGVLNNFVSRLDVTSWDINKDGDEVTWTDWDLTSIVGSTAVAALVKIQIKDDTVGSLVGLRPNGSSSDAGDPDVSVYRIHTAALRLHIQFWCELDSSQVLEYEVLDADAAAISEARLAIVGWLEPAHT